VAATGRPDGVDHPTVRWCAGRYQAIIDLGLEVHRHPRRCSHRIAPTRPGVALEEDAGLVAGRMLEEESSTLAISDASGA
jgi:hypothetical protein